MSMEQKHSTNRIPSVVDSKYWSESDHERNGDDGVEGQSLVVEEQRGQHCLRRKRLNYREFLGADEEDSDQKDSERDSDEEDYRRLSPESRKRAQRRSSNRACARRIRQRREDVLAQLESRCKHLQEQNETLLKTASAALATWQRSVEQNSALLDRILWMGSCKNVD